MKKQFTLILMLLTMLLFQACKPEVIEPEPKPEPPTLIERLQGRWLLDSMQDTHGPTVIPDTITWYRIVGDSMEYSFHEGAWSTIETRTTNGVDSLVPIPSQPLFSYRILYLDGTKTIWYQRALFPDDRFGTFFLRKIE